MLDEISNRLGYQGNDSVSEDRHAVHPDFSGLHSNRQTGVPESPQVAPHSGHLARKPTADEVDAREVAGAGLAHVVKPKDGWPVSGEDVPRFAIYLHLPGDGPEPGTLKAQLEAAYTREQ